MCFFQQSIPPRRFLAPHHFTDLVISCKNVVFSGQGVTQ